MKMLLCLMGLFFSLVTMRCYSQPMTYDHLMRNPVVLKEAWMRCVDGRNSDEMQCSVITRAAKDFSELLEEHNHDPEAFGTRLMELQIKKKKNTDASSNQFKEQKQQLNAMYSVIAATTMD